MSRVLDDLKVCLSWTWERNLKLFARYPGTRLLMYLNTRVASFNLSLSLIGCSPSLFILVKRAIFKGLTAIFCLDLQPTFVAVNSKLPDLYSNYDFMISTQ